MKSIFILFFYPAEDVDDNNDKNDCGCFRGRKRFNICDEYCWMKNTTEETLALRQEKNDFTWSPFPVFFISVEFTGNPWKYLFEIWLCQRGAPNRVHPHKNVFSLWYFTWNLMEDKQHVLFVNKRVFFKQCCYSRTATYDLAHSADDVIDETPKFNIQHNRCVLFRINEIVAVHSNNSFLEHIIFPGQGESNTDKIMYYPIVHASESITLFRWACHK